MTVWKYRLWGGISHATRTYSSGQLLWHCFAPDTLCQVGRSRAISEHRRPDSSHLFVVSSMAIEAGPTAARCLHSYHVLSGFSQIVGFHAYPRWLKSASLAHERRNRRLLNKIVRQQSPRVVSRRLIEGIPLKLTYLLTVFSSWRKSSRST